MRTRFLVLALVMAAVALFAWGGEKKQGEWVIALSNSYYGNTWRKQMVDTFVAAAEEAKQKGLIKDFVVMNGDGTQNQQVSQMNSLILQNVDAICINAASPTALNGVIDRAAKAGIKVLAFDSIATSPHCWTLDFNFVEYGEAVASYLAERTGGKGNFIQIRGVSGSVPDQQMYEGQMNILKKHPGMKIVATVNGEASATVTQQAIANVLPSLPPIDGVVTQGGGDAFGAAQAFDASQRPTPIIVGDNTSEFIQWWLGKKKAAGYETSSVGSTPGIGGAALWLAINILQNNDVPKKMSLNVFTVTQSTVDDYATLKPGTIVSPTFTNDYVVKNIIVPFRGK